MITKIPDDLKDKLAKFELCECGHEKMLHPKEGKCENHLFDETDGCECKVFRPTGRCMDYDLENVLESDASRIKKKEAEKGG